MTHATAHERLLGLRLTPEEWRDLPEDVPGELVESRLVEEVPPDIAEYAAFGIPFYWIVDPQQRRWRSTNARGHVYAPRVHAAGGIVQPVPGCPDLTIDLDVMWAKVDSLNG